jgi:hypothetical protein
MSQRILLKPIWAGKEAAIAIHQNISGGYWDISSSGKKTYMPYTPIEKARIHTFISPGICRMNHVRWNKTKTWKDQAAAKKSKWKYHPTFRGLTTTPK